MSGSDYESGSKRSGTATAHKIARHGLDNALFDAAHNISQESPISFVDNWRQKFWLELRINHRGFTA